MSIKDKDDKLSIEECRKMLSGDGIEYSDEEILRIRDFLYLLAEIEVDSIFKDSFKHV